jgi:uncharacterized membrane protein
MSFDLTWSWLALLGLGAFHGINPGMGWLFAVALGMQERKRGAVFGALLPLALGHAIAVAVAILVMGLVGLLIPLNVLRWGVAATLFGFGVYRLFRSSHPRYGGMRVGARELTTWSFMMATAHGAGLMVLPFIFGTGAIASSVSAAAPVVSHDHAIHHAAGTLSEANQVAALDHANHAVQIMSALPAEPLVGLAATLVHSIGYLFVMGLLSVVVYEKLGLRLLRTHWLNLDALWAVALIATAILTVAL